MRLRWLRARRSSTLTVAWSLRVLPPQWRRRSGRLRARCVLHRHAGSHAPFLALCDDMYFSKSEWPACWLHISIS